MLPIIGSDSQGVIDQSAWNTEIHAGMTPVTVNGDVLWSINKTGDEKPTVRNAGRTDNPANFVPRHFSATAPISLDPSNGTVFWLKSFFGKYVYAADGGGASGAHLHTINEATAAADIQQLLTKGFSYAGLGTADALGTVYDSCIVDSITIPRVENGILTADVGLMARSHEAQTLTLDGTPLAPSLIFNTSEVVVKVGVDSSEVTLPTFFHGWQAAKGGLSPSYRSGDDFCRQWSQLTDGIITVGGGFGVAVDDTEYAALIAAFDNSTEQSVRLEMTSTQFVVGSTAYSLIIDMPECKLTMVDGTTDGSLRIIDFVYEAAKDGGSNMVDIQIVNGSATL